MPIAERIPLLVVTKDCDRYDLCFQDVVSPNILLPSASVISFSGIGDAYGCTTNGCGGGNIGDGTCIDPNHCCSEWGIGE